MVIDKELMWTDMNRLLKRNSNLKIFHLTVMNQKIQRKNKNEKGKMREFLRWQKKDMKMKRHPEKKSKKTKI